MVFMKRCFWRTTPSLYLVTWCSLGGDEPGLLCAPRERTLHDVLTCLKLGITLMKPRPIRPNAEWHLKSSANARWQHMPQGLQPPLRLRNDVSSACKISVLSTGHTDPQNSMIPMPI